MTVTINGTTGYTGPIGAIGDLSTTGNTTLGDASGDTLTINGSTTTFTQGTANGVAYLNGSKVLTTGSALVFNGTNLGIGIASPTEKLEVAGTSSATAIRVSTTGGAAAFYEASAQTGTVVSRLQSNVNAAFVGTLTNQPFFFQVNGSEVARFDNSGNFGLGVTPSAWDATNGKAIQLPAGALWNYTTIQMNLGFNYFWDGTNYKYRTTGAASSFDQSGGVFYWKQAGSGTAGNNLSFTEAMRLDSSGRLLLGRTSAFSVGTYTTQKFQTTGSIGINSDSADSVARLTLIGDSSSGDATIDWGGNGNFNLKFTNNGSERARFDSLGNLLFFNSSATNKRGIQGVCAINDYWFIGGGGTASNSGYMEIATGDDGQSAGGAEPIYVSQYGPGDPLTGTLVRRATLLDNNGNTSFPGTVTSTSSMVANGYLYANNRFYPGGGMQMAGAFILQNSGATYDNSTGYRMNEGYGVQWISGGAVWHHQLTNSSYIAGFGAAGANYGSGNCYLTGTLSQNYSDIRLKNDLGTIENALDKVMTLRGFRYTINALGKELGFNDDGVEAGLSAQDVQAVLPEAVMLAGSDIAPGPDGENISKSGENYLTLRYDRVVPLLVNAIKELKAEFDAYKLTHP